MDNSRWVGSLKVVIFVHVLYIKNVQGGGWSEKNKIMSTWLQTVPLFGLHYQTGKMTITVSKRNEKEGAQFYS